MEDLQDDLYQCIGYCQVDPDTGYCQGCGRPSPAVVAGATPRGDGETFACYEMPQGECLPADNRFPVDPLSQ